MIRHFLTRQFLGFLAVGGTAAFLHWLSRIVLSFWLPFWLAVIVAYAVGMLVAFVLNALFVFPRSDKPRHRQARDFVLVNLAFLPVVWVASIVIKAALEAIGVTAFTAEIAHAAAVSLPMLATFLIYKFFAFKERP